MELYFQDHDVDARRPSETSDTGSGHGMLLSLRAAGLLSRLNEGPLLVETNSLQTELAHLMELLHASEDSAGRVPPASAKSLRMRPSINIRPGRDGSLPSCPICTETFEANEIAKKLPCQHKFHEACVTPWLKKHCTCPLCRHELPTDDEAYEEEKKFKKRQGAVSQMRSMMFN